MVGSLESGNLSLGQKIASAGLAGCTADLATFPLDTVKVWLQVRCKLALKFPFFIHAVSKNLAHNCCVK